LPRDTMRFVFLDGILGLLANQDAFKAACKRRLLGRVETRKSLEAQASGRTKKTAETRKRLCGKSNQVNQVRKRSGRQRAAARKRREQQGPGRAAGWGAKGGRAK
jgi:hypothetical protein